MKKRGIIFIGVKGEEIRALFITIMKSIRACGDGAGD